MYTHLQKALSLMANGDTEMSFVTQKDTKISFKLLILTRRHNDLRRLGGLS